MITKTEVLKAVANCERFAGFASIDNSLVAPGAITAGDLHTLIEAAKCARYRATEKYASSDAQVVLDYERGLIADFGR